MTDTITDEARNFRDRVVLPYLWARFGPASDSWIAANGKVIDRFCREVIEQKDPNAIYKPGAPTKFDELDALYKGEAT